MKQLSKHYRPTEKEFLKLAQGFVQWIKMEEASEKGVHPDAYKLLKLVTDGMDMIEEKVSIRMEREQKKLEEEAARREGVAEHCPRCNKEVPVKVIGEIKVPKTGFTHDLVKCTVCKKEFTHTKPNNDDDQVKWFAHFVKQLRNVEPNGKARWENLGRTEADLLDLELFFQKLQQAAAEKDESFREMTKLDEAADKALADMANQLLLIRIKQQQWNGGNAKA